MLQNLGYLYYDSPIKIGHRLYTASLSATGNFGQIGLVLIGLTSRFLSLGLVQIKSLPLLLLLFSLPVMSDSLQPHGLQNIRPSCPSPSPEVCPSSCPLHQWCHPAISSSDTLFSFCPQSFPASGTFPMSQLFASDNQNTRALASVLPVSIQDWSPLRLTGLISLPCKGFSGVFSSTIVRRHQFFEFFQDINSSALSVLYGPTLNIHTWLLEKP